MRIDKYLKNARIIKRRTVAKEACDQGRVLVNERKAKPGTEVVPGDRIELRLGSKVLTVEVMLCLDHATKQTAETMYEVIGD
ncbi:RNA-binding S4 domain-containing protein [Gottschalkiaceae bacterium SANA]|jgi:ribosomal 50S subunit-recycling heat shock protein|nr:RNA-binding S4 domain-containing protein [Gottschalkiaceae bacterium SANA]